MFHASLFPSYWVFIYILTFGSIFSTSAYATLHKIDEKLEGPQSAYTGYVIDLIQKWSPAGFPKGLTQEGNPVLLEGIETPDNPYYIGLKQQMIVNATLEQVEAVLDDMNHYKDLFAGFDDVHIASRDQNKILTFWEQHIPIFFVPNVTYQLYYLVDKSIEGRRIYRYQLKESGSLKFNDGVIVLEKDSSKTRYTEYDFCDADWGIAKSAGAQRIWKESVEGIYLSDLAIKFKAEHSDWTYRQIADQTRKVLETFPVEKSIEHKTKAKNLGVRFPINP